MRYPALVLSLSCIIPISVARAHGPFSTLKSRSISSDAAAFAKTSYDYIIVGAGTAGSALAAGLSESGKYKVGVLEAGISGYGESRIDVPGYFGATFGTTYDCELQVLRRKRSAFKLITIQGTIRRYPAALACHQFIGLEGG